MKKGIVMSWIDALSNTRSSSDDQRWQLRRRSKNAPDVHAGNQRYRPFGNNGTVGVLSFVVSHCSTMGVLSFS